MDQNIRPRPPVAYPTESDTTIAVGDRVRSFDFYQKSDCYFVGEVTKIDTDIGVYNIRVEFQVWEGKRSAVNHCATVRPPVNGYPCTWTGPCRGVQRMEEGAEL